MTGKEEDVEFTTNPYKNQTARTFKLTVLTIFWSSDDQVILYSRGHTKKPNLNLTIYELLFTQEVQAISKEHVDTEKALSEKHYLLWWVVLFLTSGISQVRRKVLAWAQIRLKQKISHFFCRICSWTLTLPWPPGREPWPGQDPAEVSGLHRAAPVPPPPSHPPKPGTTRGHCS